uniref:MACPF domain-containing protein n=1 Tax=Branchiostoma floridae TaxID=7739 RepID=C3ZSP3_BRAFL|eukprot:XP_002588434.1 hypothetical protein BRAFLDRAFT_63382 [Branchiostoma floridae]
MKKAVGVAVPLVLMLAVSVYLVLKNDSSKPSDGVIKRSIVLPNDLQKALRAAAAKTAPAYVKNKRFIPGIAGVAADLLSSEGGADNIGQLPGVIQKLGSPENMGPDIMSDSVKHEAEVTAEVEKEVAEKTIDQLLADVEKKEEEEEEGGDGGGEGEIKAEIDFEGEKGMVEEDMFAPPGMKMKVDIEEDPETDDENDDMSEETAFAYPMGMGTALMNGCFGTGYVPGDPCYDDTSELPSCYAAVDSAWGGSSSSEKQKFMSLIKCDVIRYEIFLDEVTPDSLSLAFLRDFLSLPKNFIQGKAKLQDFIIRYGTHFIKSAKFGGSFKLFQTQEATKTESLEDFSVQSEASYSSLFFSGGGHYSNEESSGNTASSQTSSTHLMIEGGDQEVAAIVADFYTTSFKETFTEWLKSVPSYPKPIEMFMGTMSELLNLNFKLLFPFDISDAADGCFSKKYCDVSSIEQFQKSMDKKRLALERAIAVYMEEGPIPTTDFHLQGGKPGCQTEALTVKGGEKGASQPSWLELINGDTYKYLGELPNDYVGMIVGRAEYISPLEHSQSNSVALASIVQAPCTVKWSNSYQIKPAEEGGKCLYFVAASAGDIFVVFSAIPRDKTTWYHLQISYQGVVLYKGMKLVKYEGAKSARSLGDSKLFQPYFICMEEDMENRRTYIKYGIGSDTSEKGLVYMVYIDNSKPLGIQFYSFGSGEKDVEIMDARIIEGGATGEMECTGGTILVDGMCVEDCHPECDGCIPQAPGSKLDTECRLCKNFAIHHEDGSTQCVAECPTYYHIAPDGDGATCTRPKWRDDGRCGADFRALGANPGQCDPHGEKPCCSVGGYCGGSSTGHCTCHGCVDYSANPGQCNPKGNEPCCSASGFCGNTNAHCTCSGCVDYKPKKYRDDGKCGDSYPAPGANPGQCNPEGGKPCCSDRGTCRGGNTADFCTCPGCVNYAPGANPGQCDPNSGAPCCSAGGWCGGLPSHCSCAGCRDYRTYTGK